MYTLEQRRMNNGKLVTNALQLMGGESTASNSLKQISYNIGQPEEFVEPKQVLHRGIKNGFLVKRGKSYLFPGTEYLYQADSGKRKRRRSSSNSRSSSQDTSKKGIKKESQLKNKRKRRKLKRIESPKRCSDSAKSSPGNSPERDSVLRNVLQQVLTDVILEVLLQTH